MSDRISCYMPELCIMYKPKLCRHKNQPSMKKIKYSNELTIPLINFSTDLKQTYWNILKSLIVLTIKTILHHKAFY